MAEITVAAIATPDTKSSKTAGIVIFSALRSSSRSCVAILFAALLERFDRFTIAETTDKTKDIAEITQIYQTIL